MILYLDTSSLVKLYVDETGSDSVRGYVAEAEVVTTSRIAYPEFFSAITRRMNSRELKLPDSERLCTAFEQDWGRFAALDFDERLAGELVRKHGLRGADAVHLASALLLQNAAPAIEMMFSSFDNRLNDAAAAEGFKV